MRRSLLSLFSIAYYLTPAYSHGPPVAFKDVPKETDWATRHMIEEHHIDAFDPSSFFTLHDFNNDGQWDANEIRLFYGMDTAQDPSHDTHEDHKLLCIHNVFGIFDPDNTGSITREQWLELYGIGRRLPDFGLGPGHHGDAEYEYEIHHFEKFHGEGATEEELNHPEDIEHFKMHDRMEDEQRRVEAIERQEGIVEGNIPNKFKKEL